MLVLALVYAAMDGSTGGIRCEWVCTSIGREEVDEEERKYVRNGLATYTFTAKSTINKRLDIAVFDI